MAFFIERRLASTIAKITKIYLDAQVRWNVGVFSYTIW
jgi:hypothetical protein